MASLTVRNLDGAIKQKLRERAASHGRSMEDEARRILADALHGPASSQTETGADLFRRIRQRFEGLGEIEIPDRSREPGREPPNFE